MKNNMKNLTFSEIIAAVMVFSYGSREFIRGFFWFKEQESVLGDSDFYIALHRIMPIWSWGIIVMVSALIVMLSAVYLSSSDQNTKSSWLFFIGGLLSGILYFLMTSASLYHALNWLTPAHMGLMSATGFVVSYIGGANLARRR